MPLLALAVCACSDNPRIPPAPSLEPFSETAAKFRADAVAAGSDDYQLELIDRALTGEEVSFSDLTAAVENTFACFERNGITYTRLDPHTENGYPLPNYTFSGRIPGLTEDESLAIADQCINAHSDYATLIYINQPSSIALANEHWNRTTRPETVACLESHGIEVEENWGRNEIEWAAFVLWKGENLGKEGPPTGPEC